MKARPALFTAALLSALALTLSACGGGDDGGPRTAPETEITATPQAQVTAEPSADAKVIEVKVTGEDVTPAGVGVDVKPNQPIVFKIDAAEAGELHVHSSPAQSIYYPAGTSEATITIDQPGVVEAEIEDTGTLVVQLKVS